MSDARYYNQLFDFLSTPIMPAEAHGVIAFGRNDSRVAGKVVDVSRDSFADYVVFTGGVGKDSGNLRVPEATFLAGEASRIAAEYGHGLPPVYQETEAQNGAQNVRNSLALMRRKELAYQSGLIVVAHATSSRRLAAMLETGSKTLGEPVNPIYNVPTDYPFDPHNAVDQKEAVDEMARLAEWPDLAEFRPALPQNLVDFALDKKRNG
jgi:hypothetical protein